MGALIGILLAKLLSIAGVGGFVCGLLIKRWHHVLVAGTVCGIIDTVVLASTRYTTVEPIGWIFAILVGILMAIVGWRVRGRNVGS